MAGAAREAKDPPAVGDVRSYDELSARLQVLRGWAGVSYRELHRRVLRDRRARRATALPVYDTVYRCLQPGRARMEPELVEDLARALGVASAPWGVACRRLAEPDGAPPETLVTGLPPRSRPFVGRVAELTHLVHLAAQDTLSTALVSGLGGVGKTALAVEAAHRLCSDRRRGPAFVVDLAGFAPGRSPTDPTLALGVLLRRLGVPRTRFAGAGLGRRRQLLGEAVAGQRLVLVLDNAADEAQVLPLLGLARTTLVTSRRRLALGDAVAAVDLNGLGAAESADLVATLAARPDLRTAGATGRLAELVGGLPLALVLAGRRIAARPTWQVDDHLDQLRELRAGHRLDSSVAASLRLSYLDLDLDEQRLLRLLSVHPGPGLDPYAVAAIADLDLGAARAAMAGLCRAHLADAVGPDRWSLHDLVAVFAAGASLEEDSPRERSAAVDRLCAAHAAATARAMHRYAPSEAHKKRTVPAATAPLPSFAGRDEALAWLDEQTPALVAVARDAIDHGRVEHADLMSSLLFRYLLLEHVDQAVPFFEHLVASTRGGDRGANLNALGGLYGSRGMFSQAHEAFVEALHLLEGDDPRGRTRLVIGNLGAVTLRLGDYDDSIRYSRRAAQLDHDRGDSAAASHSLNNLATALARTGRLEEAAEQHERAWALIEPFGDPIEEGRSKCALGAVRLRQGHDALARPLLAEALALARQSRYALGEADALNQLAIADSLAGHHDQAVRGHREAVRRLRALGMVEEETGVLVDLGDSLVRAGRHDDAAAVFESALDVARERADRYEEGRALAGLAASRPPPSVCRGPG